jgi:hypothetical protein
MKQALHTKVTNMKTWLTTAKAEFKPMQELKYLGEILWQLK